MADRNEKAFGQRLKAKRLECGLTHVQLAERAGLSARVISDIERAVIATPQRKTLDKLASALGIEEHRRSIFFDSVPVRRRKVRRSDTAGMMPVPVPLTTLINREKDVAAVSGLLRQTDVSFVSILGPVGVGKTRLSLAVAAKMQRTYPHAIGFVDLSAVTEPERLAGVIADRLNIRLPGGRSTVAGLAEPLRERRMLLILDNLEQVDAAEFLVALLQMTTRLKIVVTSRRALRVRGEREYWVDPLGVPDREHPQTRDELARVESVELFVRCAQSEHPSFQLTTANAPAVAEICIKLDGLPLAIELAASQVKLMSPEEMVPRLRSRLDLLESGDLGPDRHQSIRAAIAWSYDLLSEDVQRVFRRMAVFADGSSLPAAEVIGGGDSPDVSVNGHEPLAAPVRIPQATVWSAIATLIDASLLRREEADDGTARFTMLQTVRDWAQEALIESGEEPAIRARHARWAVSFAEQAEPHLFTTEASSWLNALRREQDNLCAALEWAIPHDPPLALRLAGALGDYWYLRGQIEQGMQFFRRVLARPVEDGDQAARTKALVGAAFLALPCGDVGGATRWATEARRIAGATGDRRSVGKAQAALGASIQHQGNYQDAFALHQQALEIFTDQGDRPWMINTLINLAWSAHGMKDEATAASAALRLQEVAMGSDDPFSAHVATLIQGDLALAAGDVTEAAAHYRTVFTASWQRGDQWFAADALVGAAAVMDRIGDSHFGAHLLGAAQGLYRRLGVSFPPRNRPDYDDWLASLQSHLDGATFVQAMSAGAALTPAELADIASRITVTATAPAD